MFLYFKDSLVNLDNVTYIEKAMKIQVKEKFFIH